MISWGIREKLIFGFITVIAIVGGTLFYFHYIKAASFSLYPGSCLGSWQNPYLAQGKPEAQTIASISETIPAAASSVSEISAINKENSAVFSEGGIKEIYCGSFNGDFSENEIKLIKSVNLKFSWLISDEELQAATSSITIIQPPATSSEAVTKNTNDVVNQILNNIHADEVSVIVSTTTPEITITTNTSVSETVTSTESLPSGDLPQGDNLGIGTATSSTTSFWWKKYNFFFADDEVPNTAAIATVSETTTATTSDVVVISDAFSAATSSLNSPLSPTEDFLKVSYTLDGVNWQELGTINKNNWQNASFQIPVSQLEDVKKIQIKIESLPILNKTPYVYLDNMTLEVEYEQEPQLSGDAASQLSSESISRVKKEQLWDIAPPAEFDRNTMAQVNCKNYNNDVEGLAGNVEFTLGINGSYPPCGRPFNLYDALFESLVNLGTIPAGTEIVLCLSDDGSAAKCVKNNNPSLTRTTATVPVVPLLSP